MKGREMSVSMIKSAIGLVSAMSVGAVVGNAVKATTPDNLGRLNKIAVTIGSVVIGGMVGKAANDYTLEFIDDMTGMVNTK